MEKQLIIGTANFLQEYNGHCVDEEEARKIIRYALESGVDTFDTADAYNNHNFLSLFPIKIQYKSNTLCGRKQYEHIEIKHHPEINGDYSDYNGVSVYDPNFCYHITMPNSGIIQTPLIKPDTLKQLKACGYHIQVRNVVEWILSPHFKDTIKNMWFVDSFVVGVDNLEQTKELVDKFMEAVK
jgi:hypothetical protein